MNKQVISLLLFIGLPSLAEPINCLAAPARTEPCSNLVYRAVEDPKTQSKRLFCFCKQDFDRILKLDVTDKEYILNKMEWQQILAETGYTDKQLKALIKR